MAAPLSPPPVRGGGSHELPAYISNGLIGLRVRDVPLLAGMSMISGLSGEDPERQIEAKAPSPYPVAADVCISGVWLCETLHAVSPIEQRYDFSAAELSTQLRFEAKGIKAQIDVLTFCSRTAPSLVLQEISVAVDGPCELAPSKSPAPQAWSAADGRAVRRSRASRPAPVP
jgi:protein-glucosylgalactosylhydroxylysine glucosidase